MSISWLPDNTYKSHQFWIQMGFHRPPIQNFDDFLAKSFHFCEVLLKTNGVDLFFKTTIRFPIAYSETSAKFISPGKLYSDIILTIFSKRLVSSSV